MTSILDESYKDKSYEICVPNMVVEAGDSHARGTVVKGFIQLDHILIGWHKVNYLRIFPNERPCYVPEAIVANISVGIYVWYCELKEVPSNIMDGF